VARITEGPGYDGVPDPTHDLEEGVNLFPIPRAPLVYWGICIVMDARFNNHAVMRFTGVGADFEVR
jgi:hypothetical protein